MESHPCVKREQAFKHRKRCVVSLIFFCHNKIEVSTWKFLSGGHDLTTFPFFSLYLPIPCFLDQKLPPSENFPPPSENFPTLSHTFPHFPTQLSHPPDAHSHLTPVSLISTNAAQSVHISIRFSLTPLLVSHSKTSPVIPPNRRLSVAGTFKFGGLIGNRAS